MLTSKIFMLKPGCLFLLPPVQKRLIMKKYLLYIIIILAFIPGCKKDRPTGANGLIIGKWSFLPTTYETYTNGLISHTSTQYYTLTDYAEFKSNGSFQSQSNGTTYFNQYSILGDTLIFDNINKVKIKTVTENSLSYYSRSEINATQYRITTFNFKK